MNKITRQHHKIDATGKVGGRLATEVAILLMGKQKPDYSPQIDAGDFVNIVNIDKLKFTGKKLDQKIYYKHTGYIGHMKKTKLRELMDKKPDWLFKKIVRNMLPNNRLRANRLKRLKFV